MERLAPAIEYREDPTGLHPARVGRLSAQVGRALGCSPEWADLLEVAAMLHDLGKVSVPDSIILKPGKLSPEEYELLKLHCRRGAEVLGKSDLPLLRLAAEIALTHHETWAGAGYPAGLSGEEIPLSGRIVAAVDVFDSMTHERPYRKALPVKVARELLRSEARRQFDPEVVGALMDIIERQPGGAGAAGAP